MPWFFQPAPQRCSLGAPTFGNGAVQRFKRGVMIWTEQPDAFIIVHENGQYWIVRAPYSFATPVRAPARPLDASPRSAVSAMCGAAGSWSTAPRH